MGEKSQSEMPRQIRESFERGMAAYQKNNWDYAITLFTDTLRKEPAFFECRQALRAAQFRRGGGGSGSGGLFKRLMGHASPSLAKGQLALRSNPSETLHCAELVLNDDPKNCPAHELLAKAALVLDLPQTAVLSLEIVFKNNPGDRDAALRLAEACIAAGQAQRADRIYADLLAANPADAEVARAYKDLGARRTLHEKGYANLESGTGSYRDVLKDKEEAVTLEQENRQVRTGDSAERLLAEYRSRAEREPGNVKPLRDIAELLIQKNDFDGALQALERIIAVEGKNDPSLEKLIADTRLRQIDHRIAALDPADPDLAAHKAKLETERSEFQLTECRARMEKYPSDLAIRFELGELLFKAGRITEAIQELQKAQNHPNRRIPALGLLAKCFARRGMHDIASRTLQNAIREKPVFDDEKKDLVYELGDVLEKSGKANDAVEQFKLIYEIDIGFRDVADRVDRFYASKQA
jgi:tetratricopeptide (TPR) repeat protein